MAPARPDASRRAGEWIARYLRRQLDRIGKNQLDLMLLTHLHGDHVGEVTASSPESSRGPYHLTGAADVAEAIPVRELIDEALDGEHVLALPVQRGQGVDRVTQIAV